MKNEKLKLMLNKVVEYNNPKAHGGRGHNFKAFLYKDKRGYYFKVVEIITGTDVAFNDIIYLEDRDVEFLIIADKPKLMRVSKKSWHYRLLKYVLKSQAPTPHDMQNGCPYFWLVLFSILVVPFIQLYKAIKWVILLIPEILFWVLKQLVLGWIAGLDDEAAYELNWNGRYGETKMPKTAKIFFDNSDDDFFSLFLSQKYKVGNPNDADYAEKQAEIKAKWETWRKETAAWFRNTFTVQRGRRNMIVKRTKQFVGAVVTLVILAATFIVVNYVSLALMVAADAIIAGGWKILLGFVAAAAVVGICYLLWILISSWGQAVVNKYRRGKKVWYIEPFIYLVWLPIKYLALAIAFIVAKILWIPIKFIFYTCIWGVIAWCGRGLGRMFLSLGRGIVGSTGIFGEYFGASYSDFCPGLEWVDFDED